jgi:hypothetical protein
LHDRTGRPGLAVVELAPIGSFAYASVTIASIAGIALAVGCAKVLDC